MEDFDDDEDSEEDILVDDEGNDNVIFVDVLNFCIFSVKKKYDKKFTFILFLGPI